MSKPEAVLIGPPGSGKTTVGQLLAGRLGLPFDDSDADIVRAEGRTIADIFTTDGEPAFRALERRSVAGGLVEHTGIFALGGGAVLADATRALLKDHTVIFLSVTMNEGVRRTGLSSARPLLAGVNPRAKFKSLLEARLPLYREVATIEIDTSERTPEEVVELALTGLRDRAIQVKGGS
jgi:shikimate kinase